MRFAVSVASVLGALCLLAAPAVASGPLAGRALSVGYPNGGKLVGGRRVRETPYMKIIPDHARRTAKWALPELLALLDRASRKVARRFPGSVLGIGELSNRDGGPIASHHSHQNGRDADLAFYVVNGKGRVLRPLHLVPIDDDGHSRDIKTTRFDDARNWALVSALLEDRQANVVQIFVYAPLRARLLAYAEKVGAPRELRTRAAFAMMQPANAESHDDHFHIRIACPKGMAAKGCIDFSRPRAKAVEEPVSSAEPVQEQQDDEGE